MRLLGFAVFALSALVSVPAVQSQSSPQQSSRNDYPVPTFTSTTRNVVLDVVVTDAKGQPVTGLTRNDFVIREDNTPQETRSFEAVTTGSAGDAPAPHTILLVDELNTSFEDMAYTRYSVDKLIKHGAGRLDQPTALYILTNSGLKVLANYTLDGATLDQALKAHKAVLPWRRMNASFYSMLDRTNMSLGALQQIAIANEGVPGHKNIVWISPGFPVFSAQSIGASGQKQIFDAIRRLSDQMLRARISIYSVDPRGVGGGADGGAGGTGGSAYNATAFAAYLDALSESNSAAFGDIAVQSLAVQTGGHAYFGRNDVDREIASSITDGNTYYSLSYAPSNHDFHGEFRKIKVSVIDRPGLKVQTRDGYYAIPNGAPVDPRRQLQELASAVTAPLRYTGIPIPISQCTRGRSQLSIRLSVPASSLVWSPDAHGKFYATVSIAAADRSKEGAWQVRMGRVYTFGLPEGIDPTSNRTTIVTFDVPDRKAKELRFVIRDDASGKFGSSEIPLSATTGGT